ncbi:hypothetical protein NUU61_005791, partial [Penicillium alfredii]
MWILESTGDFLDGKRVWLRPGKKYLFGRIRQDGVRHAIQHTSISRKHMIIEVSPVKPRDGTRTHARSEVSVTDLDSKCGTFVNSEQIQGQCKLAGDEHSINLGRYQHALRIHWEPVVLSFSFSSKEMKTEDPLARVCSRLEDLDIKTIIPYIVGQTTHVVQSKRNTAKGLQALINGKYIVQDSYIDALVYAATPGDLENFESLSPLETDFDAAWPDPTEHLPPAGKEPINRPAAAFAPNPGRINIFEEYTFVFGDTAQFKNLQAPITNGQGKALFYQVEDGVTTAAELVQFMRNATGPKGMGSDREGHGGVVLVRFRSKGRYEPWSIEVGNEVALMTDQRVIEQREFLDAILESDASPLCRPLPSEDRPSQVSISAPAPEPSQASRSSDPGRPSTSPQPEFTQAPTARAKGPRVRSFVSKMKTFDDGFDMESVPIYTSAEDEGPTNAPQEQAEEDAVSSLLPGARAMKRRRAEMTQHRPDADPTPAEPEAAPKRKRPKLDVLEAARKHREEEEQQRQVEEDPHASSADIDVGQLKNLAIVEEMEIPVRNSPVHIDGSSGRWDEKWNGRKNFKRFCRKGEPQYARQRVQTVIVPLEETTRKDFGIGDHYWTSEKSPDTSQPADRGHSRDEATPSQPAASPDPTPDPRPAPTRQKRPREVRDSDSEDELRFRFRRRRYALSHRSLNIRSPILADIMGIIHIIMFQMKADADPVKLQEFCNTILGLKDRCRKPNTQQPYIQTLRGGEDISPENIQYGITHVFMMEFTNDEDWLYFLHQDPIHLELKQAGTVVKPQEVDIRIGVKKGILSHFHW